MEKEVKYRVIKNTWFENGEPSQDNNYFEVQRFKKFLWWYRWSTMKKPDYDSSSPIRFKTIEEALEFIQKMKDGKPAYGWRENVVWSDPEFQKLD